MLHEPIRFSAPGPVIGSGRAGSSGRSGERLAGRGGERPGNDTTPTHLAMGQGGAVSTRMEHVPAYQNRGIMSAVVPEKLGHVTGQIGAVVVIDQCDAGRSVAGESHCRADVPVGQV